MCNSYQEGVIKNIGYLIGILLITLFMGVTAYLIYDSVMSGVVLMGGKAGPVNRYSFAEQPRMFWFGIFMYAILFVILGGCLNVMRLLARLESHDDQ